MAQYSLLTLGIDFSRLGIGLTIVLFIFLCVVLVLTILIQKPQGGGLSGAFGAGSSGSGQTAFGTKTGDALTFITVTIFVLYLMAAIAMNFVMRPPSAVPSAPVITAPAPAPTTGTTDPNIGVTSVVPPPASPVTTPSPVNPAPTEPAPGNPAPVNPNPDSPK